MKKPRKRKFFMGAEPAKKAVSVPVDTQADQLEADIEQAIYCMAKKLKPKEFKFMVEFDSLAASEEAIQTVLERFSTAGWEITYTPPSKLTKTGHLFMLVERT